MAVELEDPQAPPAPPGATTDVPVEDLVRQEADKQGIPRALALAVADQESGFNPTLTNPQAVNGEHAVGTFQLLPSTAKLVNGQLDPNNPQHNIQIGVAYLRQLMDQHQGDLQKTLASYGGVKKDTTYVPSVLARLQKYQQSDPDPADGSTSQAGPPPRPPYDPGWEAQNPVKAYLAAMISGEPPPKQATPAEAAVYRAGAGATKFLHEATTSLNPVNIVKGIDALNTAVQQDPVGLVRSMWDANAKLREEGRQLMDQARTTHDFSKSLEGLGRIAEGMIPIFGPRLAEADKWARGGEYARSAGAVADVAGQVAGPAFLEESQITPRVFKPRLQPNEAAAVKFGEPHGVVDLATATGNLHARTLQQGAEAMPGGAIPGEVARWRRQQKLPQMAEDLASQVHPTPVPPEEAGLGLRTGTQGYITGQDAIADQSYATLRAAEADPQFAQTVQTGTTKQWAPDGTLVDVPVMETMPLPADVRAAKAQLKPILDEYLRDPSAVVVADASPGLAALRDIVNGSDFMRASDLQKRLSAIGKLSRGADLPALRGVSQGLAAKAYEVLQAPYQAAVKRAGPAAEAALDVGRAATTAKYGAEDTLGKLGTENVGAFQSAVRPNDAGFGHLSELARMAPQEIPKVARAVLDTIMGHGTGLSGGWSREAGTALKWEHLGPQTKQLLFGNRTADLDHFFLLQRMLAKSANPSRSALAALSLSSYAAALKAPWLTAAVNAGAGVFSILANTRTGVRLLTKGLTIPAGTAAAAAYATEVGEELRRMHEAETVGQPPPTLQGLPPPAPPR